MYQRLLLFAIKALQFNYSFDPDPTNSFEVMAYERALYFRTITNKTQKQKKNKEQQNKLNYICTYVHNIVCVNYCVSLMIFSEH